MINGSMFSFQEHVFWVVSLNTLFILVFGKCREVIIQCSQYRGDLSIAVSLGMAGTLPTAVARLWPFY